MLRYGGGDPGVRQLEQQRPARAKENRRLAVDPPRQESGPKIPSIGPAAASRTVSEPVFKIIGG